MSGSFLNYEFLLMYLLDLNNLQGKVKEAFCFKNGSNLSLLEKIVLVTSKRLKILGLLPQISKLFSRSLKQFFLAVSQNNFGNKTPFFIKLHLFVLNGFATKQKKVDLTRAAKRVRCVILNSENVKINWGIQEYSKPS